MNIEEAKEILTTPKTPSKLLELALSTLGCAQSSSDINETKVLVREAQQLIRETLEQMTKQELT